MTTSAQIILDWDRYTSFYVKADGYPDEIVEMLLQEIENQKEFAESQYENSRNKWRRELKMEFQDREGVEEYRNQGANWYYNVGKEAGIYYKERRNQDWKHVSTLPDKYKEKIDNLD